MTVTCHLISNKYASSISAARHRFLSTVSASSSTQLTPLGLRTAHSSPPPPTVPTGHHTSVACFLDRLVCQSVCLSASHADTLPPKDYLDYPPTSVSFVFASSIASTAITFLPTQIPRPLITQPVHPYRLLACPVSLTADRHTV